MADSFLMQAVSDDDGELYTWTATSKDWAAAGFPGPGSALYVAVADGRVDNVAASVADGAVSTVKLANGAVTPAKLDAHAGAYGTYAAARAALTAGNHAAGDTFRTASRSQIGDGGNNEWQVVAIGSYVDNGGSILTGGSFAALRKTKGDIIHAEEFGLSESASASDNVTALQAAIDSVGVTITSITQTINTAKTVLIPEGNFTINATIATYSSIELRGSGVGSRLTAHATFTGSSMIALRKSASGLDRYHAGKICKLSFSGAVDAIVQDTPLVLNSVFEDLYFNTPGGIIVDTYTQKCEIRRLYSFGSLDRFVVLAGNDNIIEDIDKEGGSGSSTDPYVHVSGDGNFLQGILLEGTGSVNKTPLVLENANETTIDGYWDETTTSNGVSIHFLNCGRSFVRRPLFLVLPTQRVKLEASVDVEFSSVSVNGTADAWEDSFEVDSDSFLRIGTLVSRTQLNPNRIAATNISVGRHVAAGRWATATPNAALPPANELIETSSQNLLINHSFEAGIHAWSHSGTGSVGTSEVIASEVNTGLMYHFAWTGGSCLLTQNVTIPADVVGMPMVLSYKVKFETTTAGVLHPEINGVGISTASGYFGYNAVNDGSGWHYVSQVFVPQSAGTMGIGVRSQNATDGEVWIDDVQLSFGRVATGGGSARFASVELSNRTVMYGTAVPSTGTWKVGDLRFNSSPSVGAPTGWVCTVAGTPGTWVAFGVVGAMPLTGSTSLDAPSVADQASYTSAGVTVTGAALGDRVTVTCSLDLQGLVLTGYVSASNTVKFVLSNQTGAPVDLSTATYKFWVTPQ